ncbi:hypothetical protein [Acetobacterium carbinolicum]|jgi:hypothetical protein|uniref:hypothetical protein n=1 Tax=Acetobacterium carbinolicum TaxID=52690 RepID=UPI0039C9B098
MKRKYYIDLTLLIIMIILFVATATKIADYGYLVAFSAFLIFSIYENLKFKIVLEYPYEGSQSIFEILMFIMVLTGKITFIISLGNVVYVNPNENLDMIVYGLLILLINTYIFTTTSYIQSDNLIYHFNKPVKLEFISGYEVREKALDTYYCNIYLKSDKILSLRLSESSYQKLEHYY